MTSRRIMIPLTTFRIEYAQRYPLLIYPPQKVSVMNDKKCKKNSKPVNEKVNKPNILTDISLLSSQEPPIDQFHKIVANYRPHKIELGNENLYDYAINYFKKIRETPPLMIVPSPKNPAEYPLISYKTSMSPLFLYKTEKITVEDTKTQLNKAVSEAPHAYKKLYVSCLTECPFTGKIDVDYTLHELCLYYHKYELDEITLCDTCGKLSFENFRYLVSSLLLFGVPKSRIGFQFRITDDFYYIQRYAREHGFMKWDVVETPVYIKRRQISYEDII